MRGTLGRPIELAGEPSGGSRHTPIVIQVSAHFHLYIFYAAGGGSVGISGDLPPLWHTDWSEAYVIFLGSLGARLRLGSAPWPRPDAFLRAARGRFSAWPRLGLPGPAIAMARPRTWPGPSGRPLLGVCFGRPPAQCRAEPLLFSLCGPGGPSFRPGSGSQVRPLRRPDPGPPSGPDGPVLFKTVSCDFSPCRLREAQLRAAPGLRGRRPRANGRDLHYWSRDSDFMLTPRG